MVVFSLCVYIYAYICVCMAGMLKAGTLTTDSWISDFESQSYNRDHEANQTSRAFLQSLDPAFTSLMLIAGISKAIPEKEALYTRLFSLIKMHEKNTKKH